MRYLPVARTAKTRQLEKAFHQSDAAKEKAAQRKRKWKERKDSKQFRASQAARTMLSRALLKAIEFVFPDARSSTGYRVDQVKFDDLTGAQTLQILEMNPSTGVYRIRTTKEQITWILERQAQDHRAQKLYSTHGNKIIFNRNTCLRIDELVALTQDLQAKIARPQK